MRRIAVIGSRDLGQQMAPHFSRMPDTRVVGFFDDFRPAGESTPGGPVLAPVSEVAPLFRAGAFDEVAIGIGYRHLPHRGRVIASLLGTVPFATYVHPTCWVDPTAQIREGAFLLPHCVVDANAVVGIGSVMNVGGVLCHDSVIGENCFLGPRVTIAGFVKIEAGCFLGVGTIVVDNVSIGPGVQTGGGAVVVRSEPTPGLYVGAPARRKE